MSSATRSALIAIAAADPSPAAVITCARGLPALPATQTPGTLVSPVASTETKPASSSSQPSDASRPSACAWSAGRMKTAARGMLRPSASSHGGETIVDDRRAARRARRRPGCRALSSAARSSAVTAYVCGEEDDVVRPLPKQLRVVDGARAGPEDADRLVAHLPAVAVRAVQEIAAPALAGAGDVGQLVVRRRSRPGSAGLQRARRLQGGALKPAVDRDHPVVDRARRRSGVTSSRPAAE